MDGFWRCAPFEIKSNSVGTQPCAHEWAMVLEDIDKLSDDSGENGPKDRPTGNSPKPSASPTKKLPKAKGKPKAKGSPKVKTTKPSEPEPSAKAVLKRPSAAAPASAGTTVSPSKLVIKRPAGRAKDPDHVSASKSRYKNGYTIKLFGKEVIRVSKLHKESESAAVVRGHGDCSWFMLFCFESHCR